jgi:hypothetical protein
VTQLHSTRAEWSQKQRYRQQSRRNLVRKSKGRFSRTLRYQLP